MFDLVDLLLLRRGIPADDRTLTFHRVDGNTASRVIYFLPWHTPFGVARQAGFISLDFLACYEMPSAIVSSEPGLCREAMLGLVADAERLLVRTGAMGKDAVIVGLSVGTYPATYLANRHGARLCSIASADRADLAFWQSPATRLVRRRAAERGFGLCDYSRALAGTHPAQNLAGLARNSTFVVGLRDPFVPPRCKAGLLHAIGTHAPGATVVTLDAGHFKTMVMSGQYQPSTLGVEACRSRWRSFLRARPGDVDGPADDATGVA